MDLNKVGYQEQPEQESLFPRGLKSIRYVQISKCSCCSSRWLTLLNRLRVSNKQGCEKIMPESNKHRPKVNTRCQKRK